MNSGRRDAKRHPIEVMPLSAVCPTWLNGTSLAAFAHAERALSETERLVYSATVRDWQGHLGDHGQLDLAVVPIGPVTVRAWLLPDNRPIGPVLNNLAPSTLAEVALELVAAARRTGAAPTDRLVLLVQHFVAADVSVLVRAKPSGSRLRLFACWGLAERIAEPVHFDQLVVEGNPPRVQLERLACKKSRTMPVGAGTLTVPVEQSLQLVPALARAELDRVVGTVSAISKMTRQLERPLDLEFGLIRDEVSLLDCRLVSH